MLPEEAWAHSHRFCKWCGWVPLYAWQAHLCTHDHLYQRKLNRLIRDLFKYQPPTARGLHD